MGVKIMSAMDILTTRKALANPTSIEAFVRIHDLLPAEAITRAASVTSETGERFDSVITRLGLIAEVTLAEALSHHQKLPLLTPAAFPKGRLGGADLSASFLRDMRALPIVIENDHVIVALANPFDDFAAQALGFAFGKPARRVVALPSHIESAIDRLYGTADASGEAAAASADEDDLERLRDLVSDAPVIRAVNRLIADAVDARASDIHVEPTEDRVVIRLRVDGVLVEAPALPASMRTALVSRIKVMADLNIAERRLPQDGRMRVAVRGNEIDLRVATAPSIYGESVVMRILDRANLALDFGTLGFSDAMADKLRHALAKPYGIVLVTGPTGSGKTTTLYAALSEMNTGARKILTVEDPIEYRLPGIVQTQVNAGIGLTFAAALRSFLRQDPDVMMVGEIRDLETAQIAVQSALTGHIILSTLHTNTAAGAVTRLLDMNVEPFLLTSTLSAVLAQRLVRRLCRECREGYHPSETQCAALGLAPLPSLTFYKAVGCPVCRNRGYSGRIALIELLIIDDDVAPMILKRADTREIVSAAKRGALSSMLSDGIAKLGSGDTTIEEVLRVVAEGY
ncbi:MAG: GspE/PulE family protein [Sphingomonadaceae bacterium]